MCFILFGSSKDLKLGTLIPAFQFLYSILYKKECTLIKNWIHFSIYINYIFVIIFKSAKREDILKAPEKYCTKMQMIYIYLYCINRLTPFFSHKLSIRDSFDRSSITTCTQPCRYCPLWAQGGPHGFKTRLLG